MKKKISKIGEIASMVFLLIGILIIIILLIFTMIGRKKDDTKNLEEKEIKNDSEKFKEEYEALNNVKIGNDYYIEMEIKEDNFINYATYNQINEYLDNGTGVILFSSRDNQFSRQIITILFQAIETTDIDKIYYLNIKNNQQLNTNNYKTLVEKIALNLLNYQNIQSYNKIEIPTILFVKEGQIIEIYYEIFDSQNEMIILTNDQKKELYRRYLDNLKLLLD